jgi:hypothetical protein
MFKTKLTWCDGKRKLGRFQSRVLIPPWALIISILFISSAAQAVNFGQTPVSTSALQTITVSNPLTNPLSLGTIGLVSNEFKIQTDNCSNTTLAASGSCEVIVAFTPQAVGAKTAELTIFQAASTTPLLTIPLEGEGIANDSVSPILPLPIQIPSIVTPSNYSANTQTFKIPAGFDLLETPSNGKTFIDFSSKGGPKVQLVGNPDPLDSISDKLKRVDTIVKRKNEISLVSGGKGVVEIELVALSLKSTSSFDIGFLVGAKNSGVKADLYVTVNTLELPDLPPKLTKTSSTGKMVICNQNATTLTSENVNPALLGLNTKGEIDKLGEGGGTLINTISHNYDNNIGKGQFASSTSFISPAFLNSSVEFKNVSPPCQGGTFESELKVYSDLIFVKPGGDLKNSKDWLFLMPDPTAPISLNGHGEWSNSPELGGFTVSKLEHDPHNPVPLVSLPIPPDLPENVIGIPEIQQILEAPMSQEIRNILINGPADNPGKVDTGTINVPRGPSETDLGSIINSVFIKSYQNTLIQPTYLPYRFGSLSMKAQKRKDSQLFDALSQAFLTTLGESLASFNLSEVTVEINETMKRLEIPLFSPENTLTAWYSAFAIEPVVVKSEEKSELGLFKRNDGTVYLVFAGNDHQNYESTLLPALDSDIAKAFLETFPEATLEQSPAGKILFTLAGKVQQVKVDYVVTAVDLNTSQLSIESNDLNEDGKIDYILSAFGKQQVAFGQ